MPEPNAPTILEERRRAPRFDMPRDETAVLAVNTSVRILDISVSGVMVESAHAAETGTRGRLRMDLEGMPFAADVEVRRVSGLPGTNLYRIGAMFLSLSSEHAQMIARLTRL